MISKRYENKNLVDNIFATSKRAKNAIKKYGKENVINATLGSLYTEDEKFAVYDVVEEVYRKLPPEDIYSYSTNVIGEDDYLEEVKKALLGENYSENFKNLYFSSIATPGGTGAISNTIKNYLNPNETVLLPNWMWGTYKNIVFEYEGKTDTYNLFDDEFNFDFKNFEKKVNELKGKQENLIIVINEPSHNPTGFRMNYEDWVSVYKFLNEISKDINVILIRDVAYFEYDDRDEKENKKIINLLKNISENLLVVYTFSLSKSLSLYGMRVGAQIAVSSSRKVIDEFEGACSFSCRVTWSNINKGGMVLFSKIMMDANLKKRFLEEKKNYMSLLRERADIFKKEAIENNLKILPYRSGFFITISVGANVDKVLEKLEEKNIFVIKFNDGIRIGICSVPKYKIKGLAKKIKNVIDEIKD